MIASFRAMCLCFLLSLPVVSAPAQTSKVNSVLDMPEFIHDWQISKQFTLDVAHAMSIMASSPTLTK